MSNRDFIVQLEGFSLTTAEIVYHLPDYPALLQSYVWQDYDNVPLYPKLLQFLDFWTRNLDGRVNRVVVNSKRLISPTEFRFLDGEFVRH